MRALVEGRRLGRFQIRVLPLRDHISYLRRGDNLLAAFCSIVWQPAGGRICCDDDFFAVAGRRAGLGMAQRSAHLEVAVGLWHS